MRPINPVHLQNNNPVPKEELKTAKLSVLADKVKMMAKDIQSSWDRLYPQDLAEKIIDFHAVVANASFPGAKKMQRLANEFHFQFVFPIVKDFKTFAKEIHKIADQILKTNSLAPFAQLSPTQQKEILRRIS